MGLTFFKRLGPLRSGLATLTFVVMAAAPFADGTVHMHDWRLFPSVIAPTIVMMLAFTFPLDLTMTRIFMQDAGADERRRLAGVMRFEAVLLVAMLAAWTPFMLKVLDFSPFS
ncbi:MAG: hypothetical protein ACU85U_10455 [Gammaproteobacteria bacterium]|jgi:L-lactate permease